MNASIIAFVADAQADTEQIKSMMASQIASRVRWCEIIGKMLDDGVDTFIEVGPGKALSGFVRNVAKTVDKEIRHFNVENIATLEKTIEALNGEV